MSEGDEIAVRDDDATHLSLEGFKLGVAGRDDGLMVVVRRHL